jgi:flavin reductase (DIM6/NTAB) family NADH-FMN oxidoreductase RutF
MCAPLNRAGTALDGVGAVLGSRVHPMAVVTARAGDAYGGCLVGFHTQCSIDPARYLVCLSSANRTWHVANAAHALAVHFLAKADVELARLFGEVTGDDADKFTRCEWSAGPFGLPILEHNGSWLAGPIVSRHMTGDHQAVVIDAVEGGGRLPWMQLQSSDVEDLRPGHPA